MQCTLIYALYQKKSLPAEASPVFRTRTVLQMKALQEKVFHEQDETRSTK